MAYRSKQKLLFLSSIFVLTPFFSSLALAHGWKAPEDIAQIKNPIPINETAIGEGQKIFINLCSTCHGNKAEGGAALDLGIQPSPPDLRKRLKAHSDGDFFWKVKTGKRDMPSFAEDLEDKEIWYIIAFIRNLIE